MGILMTGRKVYWIYFVVLKNKPFDDDFGLYRLER